MRKKLLCIEGDCDLAAVIAHEFAIRHYDVVLAYDGMEGLAAVLRTQPDIVLCDVLLPVMTGFELRDRLIALTPQFGEIPFVFLGEHGDPSKHGKRRHLDVDAHIHLDVDAHTRKLADFSAIDGVICECLAKIERTKDWSRRIELNDREVECLTWAVRGKTSNEIAKLIGSLKRNVDFYIEMACRKLKVSMRIPYPLRTSEAGLSYR